MSLAVNHNIMALNAARHLGDAYSRLSASVARLSSGQRLTSAAADPAGLAVSLQMRAEIATLHKGLGNLGGSGAVISAKV